jgi:hypothetical protein
MTATLAELRKKPEASLTPEEKKALHGEGNHNVVRYAKRGNTIVARTFGPDEEIGKEWTDSPAKLGAPESHPGRDPSAPDPTETVVAIVSGKAA